MAGVQVLVRAYQALREIRLMVAIGVGVVALNLVLMPLGTTLIGFRGLPLAISVSTVTLFVIMLMAVGSRLPGLDPVGILAGAARVALAGAIALGVAQVTATVAPGGAAGIVIVAGASGVVAYVVALMLVSRDDARLALDFVAPWLGRPRPASV
jgi:peptidoglycan biosynthesis protein MviN/MurJ (putative lipid II flippase)